MNKIKYLIIVFSLIKTINVQSCINEYRTLLSGEVVYIDAEDLLPQAKFSDKTSLLKELGELEKLYNKTKKIEDYSDLGSMYVYLGNYNKAKLIFKEIEKKSPGRYQTAANLGTTYELLEQNDSALYWIKRAVKINPNSHDGSEWIHIKILETKIKAKGDNNKLWNQNILSLNFGSTEIPQSPPNVDLNQLEKHLYIQLCERMTFIKPKNPIVAQLLFDLGNVRALTSDVKSGLLVFQIAQEYGYSSEILNKRLLYFETLQQESDINNQFDEWSVYIWIFVVILCSFLIYRVVVALRNNNIANKSL
ncbi:MAG: tetratricopeptide repeat protein [Cytophagales bacterium]